MADAPTLSPDLSRSVLVLARTHVAAVRDAAGDHVLLEEPMLVNTWEPDRRGGFPWAVVEAVDPETAGIDPLKYM